MGAEIEERVVYLLRNCQIHAGDVANSKNNLRAGPGLPPLTLETSNALLPPFGSHLVGEVNCSAQLVGVLKRGNCSIIECPKAQDSFNELN